MNVVYQVVYPDEFNLKPTPTQRSRGRPKKLKIQPESPPSPQSPQKTKIKAVLKTRSGREVKLPKYIENEFKKIEINDDLPPDSIDVKISDFVKYLETDEKDKSESQNKLVDQLDLLQKKRRIPAQYRCPKCKKAYLGRSKILEHLRKNPSHGPMHQNEENNFEVWNYLVNVTQKCPSSERGQKFCQELSNLLHNLLLLTNALFKKLGSAANEVKVDKVLGNAIGLTPGNYFFDDNNLYKNVTVLKLMANNDFLHSVKSKTDDNIKSTILSGTNCSCGKETGINEMFLKSMLICPETDNIVIKQPNSSKTLKQTVDVAGVKSKIVDQNDDVKKFTGDEFFASLDVTSQPNFLTINDYKIKNNLIDETNPLQASINEDLKEQNSVDEVKNVISFNGKESSKTQNFCKKNVGEENKVEPKTFSEVAFFSSGTITNNFPVNDYDMKEPYVNSQIDPLDEINTDSIHQKQKPLSPKINIQNSVSEVKNVISFNGKESSQTQSFCKKMVVGEENKVEPKTFSEDEFFSSDNVTNNFPVNDYDMKEPYVNSQIDPLDKINTDSIHQKQKPSSPKIKIQSNILICPPRFYQKNTSDFRSPVNPNGDNKSIISPELMTDNSVLIPVTNLRSIDELMLPVPSESTNILDNSSSSDEAMNVDQFVNERFRKITESDLEIINGSSLSLELPTLDLFQFHTS